MGTGFDYFVHPQKGFYGFLAFQGVFLGMPGVVLKRTGLCVMLCGGSSYVFPRMRRANCMSLGIMVTLLAWIAHRFVSLNSLTKYASVASRRAKSADDWNRRSGRKSVAISLTNLWKGSFLISSTDPFW